MTGGEIGSPERSSVHSVASVEHTEVAARRASIIELWVGGRRSQEFPFQEGPSITPEEKARLATSEIFILGHRRTTQPTGRSQP